MRNPIIVMHEAVPSEIFEGALSCIQGVPLEEWEEYRHPFEPKLMLPKRFYREPPIAALLGFLHSDALRDRCAAAFGLYGAPLRPGGEYWTAFYRYRPGDYLQMHLDTAIHEEERKVVTLNLYLEGCEGGEFLVGPLTGPFTSVPAAPNLLAIMANDDAAFHCVEPIRAGSRLMVTTAFVMPVRGFPLPLEGRGYTSTNRKAWFVPKPGEEWTAEQYRLRDERAGIAPAGAGAGAGGMG